VCTFGGFRPGGEAVQGSSVFTAVLFPLLMAIIYINRHIQVQSLENKHNSNKYIVFSDSLCALFMLSGCKTGSNPELAMLVRQQIQELVSVQNMSLILAWVPAHCGLAGNQAADSLAKNDLHIQLLIELLGLQQLNTYIL